MDRPRRSVTVKSYHDSSDHIPLLEKAQMKSRKRKAKGPSMTSVPHMKRRRKAKLERFLELPLDVVNLIAEFLDPKTLISFSRVSRTFRLQFSTDIPWMRCREGAGLPSLEAKDITDRQYIHLLFDTHCHDCGAENIQKLDLRACLRLCGNCKTNLYNQPHDSDNAHAYHPHAWACAKSYQNGYWPMKKWKWLTIPPRGIKKISQKLHCLSGQELDDFIQSRLVLKAQIARDAQAIEVWFQDQDSLKREENVKMLSNRVELIGMKLIDLGWSSAMLDQLSLSSCKNVSIAKPLTERGWAALRPSLLNTLREHLQVWRISARKSNIVKAYDSFFEREDDKPLFPSLKTFLSFDAVQNVLNTPPSSLISAPELEPFEPYDKALWDAAYPTIAYSIREYQSQVTDHARILLTKAYAAAQLPCPPNTSILTDPRSLFHVTTERNSCVIYQVRRFPLIHEVMRDRQDVGKWGGTGEKWKRNGLASEFLEGHDKLKVDLRAWEKIKEKGSGWVINEEGPF
ncbi:hypothetical protein DL96DRAFT_1643399 [Flagelloscypha sp. PMI_526]|nr:hypothetical protein DL96DRAFT_1643399 [Flagelloscypha sp. PMI_526]